MNQITHYMLQLAAIIAIALLSACGDKDSLLPDAGNEPSGVLLSVNVSADGFAGTGGPTATRVADSGYETIFQTGDQMGIVEIFNGTKLHHCFTYDAATGNWSPQTPAIRHTSGMYVAYFPYSENLNVSGITSPTEAVTAIKAVLPPLADQSGEKAYRLSDLMMDDAPTFDSNDNKLTVNLTHAYSLLILQVGGDYKTSTGYIYFRPVLAGIDAVVSMTKGSNTTLHTALLYKPGGYRLIVDASGTGSNNAFVEWSYSTAGGNYKQTNTGINLPGSGQYRSFNPPTNIAVRELQRGDFYYADGGILPHDESNPTKVGCLGTVFWVGDATQTDPLLAQEKSHCTNGLVLALAQEGPKDGPKGGDDDIQARMAAQTANYPGFDLRSQTNIQGYANTKVLEAYNRQDWVLANNRRITYVDYVQKHRAEYQPAAPETSSDWYLPSAQEMKKIFYGDGTVNLIPALNAQRIEVGGEPFLYGYENYTYSYFWSSTEINAGKVVRGMVSNYLEPKWNEPCGKAGNNRTIYVLAF